MTKPFNIKSATFLAILTLMVSVKVNAQSCASVSSPSPNIAVSGSCDTGINLTGNENLSIAPPTNGITVSNANNTNTVNVDGAANTINITGGNFITGNDQAAIFISNLGLNTTITNSGSITGVDQTYGIQHDGTGTALTNSGNISSGNLGIAITNITGTIGTLNNTGTIFAGQGSTGILNFLGNIDSLTNLGTISTGANGIGIRQLMSAIDTLTNLGTISTGLNGFGIDNTGSIIGTLANVQGVGNPAGALTYKDNLPISYNIIIRSPTEYGQLAVTSPSGSTTFGIFAGSIVRNGIYASVLTGVTANELSNTSGTYGTGGVKWTLAETTLGSGIWDLFLTDIFSGPNTADTQQSLVNNASALQNTFTLQNTILANSFSYDCPVFGGEQCVRVCGRS